MTVALGCRETIRCGVWSVSLMHYCFDYNDSMFSAQVLNHFEHPRNPGEVKDADVTVQLENPGCGDVLKLSIKVSGDELIEARFLAKGCVPAIACGSLLTELIVGKPVKQIRALTREELVRAIGGLPESSVHASHLAFDTLQAALKR